MSWKTRLAVAVLSAAAFAAVSGAQGPPAAGGRGGAQGGRGAPAGRGAPVPFAKTEIKPGLFMITGAGANSVVRVTPDGLILVDTKLDSEANFTSLMEQIKSISEKPVKIVLNTQHHPDHTGNNQRFIDAGAKIIASEALKAFMASDPRTTAIPGRPTETFATKDNVVKLGGISVEQHFYGRGHTGDDTMTYFPDLKVLMVSDDVTDGNPVIDWANGGSWLEWSRALESALKLDFDVAIPGAGAARGKAEIQAFKTKVDLVISRATEAVKKGATRDQLMAQVKTDDLAPWNLNAQFFQNLYDEMAKAK